MIGRQVITSRYRFQLNRFDTPAGRDQCRVAHTPTSSLVLAMLD